MGSLSEDLTADVLFETFDDDERLVSKLKAYALRAEDLENKLTAARAQAYAAHAVQAEARDECEVLQVLLKDSEERRRELEHELERDRQDVHNEIRLGYDKTVADCWRAEVAKKDARIAELEADHTESEKSLIDEVNRLREEVRDLEQQISVDGTLISYLEERLQETHEDVERLEYDLYVAHRDYETHELAIWNEAIEAAVDELLGGVEGCTGPALTCKLRALKKPVPNPWAPKSEVKSEVKS